MVFEALELIRSELEAYLKPLVDPITVKLGNIATVAGTQANSILITLVNIEEEATLKNSSSYQRNAAGGFDIQNPPVFLNLYVLISANHINIDDYESALKMLSWIIQCFQKKNQYTLANTPAATALNDAGPGASPIDPRVMLLCIVADFYSLSFERLNQLWGTLGGKQVPAVMYKIRVVEEQAGGQLGAGPAIQGIEGRVKRTTSTPN
ncbi:hypothetical protein GCM10028808_27540 [Spirosoma migulaei]